MIPERKIVIALTLWSLLLVSASVPAAELGHALSPLREPAVAADFSLRDMDENVYPFKKFRGRVVMLNFWATWCPPCRKEMPSLERLFQSLQDEGLVVLAINQWETPDHVFAFLGQLDTDPSFPILFDPDSTVATAYEVKGLPTTFLIDKQGRIRYRAVGGREFDHPEVENTIRDLLQE